MDRRRFLGAALGAGAFTLTGSFAHAGVLGYLGGRRDEDQPILVLLELGGGNDGLNTVVPHADDAYHAARKRIAHPASKVLDLDGHVGLAPQFVNLRREFGEGRLAVVQGAGYPEPNRSHFKSMEVWHTGHAEGRDSGPGWIGNLANAMWDDDVDPNRLVHVGSEVPYSLQSRRHPALNLKTPENYRWAGNEQDVAAFEPEPMADTGEVASQLEFLRGVMRDAKASSLEVRQAVARYRPSVEYPSASIAQSLAVCAALVDSRIGCRVLSVQQRSYDTHSNQVARQATLHEELDGALDAFVRDLRAKGNDGPVVVLAYSEFGRRVQENGSQGTDHGTAGPMFLLGSSVQGGLHGRHPSLTDLDERGDMVFSTDFRCVYATVIERWFGVDPRAVLGDRFTTLDLLPKRTSR
ncbi:MAG: DUF1501 domain-containing protein [Planctomycetota bacterium]